MAKKKEIVEEVIEENISSEPLESVMGDRYAVYAKYVIQDRAIPDVRDGLKPVQRRIIFSMYKDGNVFNKPTRKCAHTVGAVMGTYHPHGDTSIYEAMARMSQDWKMRYPLITFQGNNGSIDGDSPAAYRYTEAKLSELSNELVRELDKETVDMQLNFDDTEYEPIVLPSRFPNLLANGTDGIAVGIATEIPPHNLRELIEAINYRITHKTATVDDLLQFIKGPDFPTGGIIYESSGLKDMYYTGRGRIEMAAKAEIVSSKDLQQIIITEIPYKTVKIQIVHEIDKIRHSKSIDGILEVRDESDWQGIRIVVDVKKDAKADLILKYLMHNSKTFLKCGYTANMNAIVNGHPQTLDLLTYVDSYIAHQVDVVTRQSKFDLNKCKARLHIVEGLLLASININEVVAIIRASKDKADSKVNLIAKYGFTNEQAEAIVMMPLYKLSHTDEQILLKEKETLEESIAFYEGLLSDSNKLNRVIMKDLNAIAAKYGDDRRTQIIEKEEFAPIDKRELISKDEVVLAITRDGYIKRSSIKSFRSNNGALPGYKDGDVIIGMGNAFTTDYLLSFTNKGNYIVVPVHLINETKWKDEGMHINTFTTLGNGEKIVRTFAVEEFRNNLYLAFVTKMGQIKRSPLSDVDITKHSRPARAMSLDNNDEIITVALLSGDSDILVISNNGEAVKYNENELRIISFKAGGLKAMKDIGKSYNYIAAMVAFEENDRTKCILYTDKGHKRVFDASKIDCTKRMSATTSICPSFKNDVHNVVSTFRVGDIEDLQVALYYDNHAFDVVEYQKEDLYVTDYQYAKKNIELPKDVKIENAYIMNLEKITKKTPSHPVKVEEKPVIETPTIEEQPVVEEVQNEEEEKKPELKHGQLSIFDDFDD